MMSNPEDDAIDALLREDFDGPLPIGDFGERVMDRLPRRRRRRWPLAAGIVAGIGGCWLNLISTPLLQAGWSDWLRGDPSQPAIALLLTIAATSLLALAWAALEAGASRAGRR